MPVTMNLEPAVTFALPTLIGDTAAASITEFDVLDLVLISPVLVPIFALLAFSASGGAAQAALDKFAAEQAAQRAKAAQDAAEKKVADLEAKVVAADERLKEKVTFFESKLADQVRHAGALVVLIPLGW